MPKETEEARLERKRRFIKEIRDRKCRELIEPLLQKAQSFMNGEIPPLDVFKAAHYVARRGDEITGDFKKKPDVVLAGIAMDENRYFTEIGDVAVKVRRGDVLSVFADAVVNPASPDGTMTKGLAGAIKEAGGGTIEKEAAAQAPIAAGTAVATGAGSLPFLHIIHAPTAETPGGASSPETVRAAVSAALVLAEELWLETVTVPGLGTGAGGLSPGEAAAAIVDAIAAHKAETVSGVTLVDIHEETVDAFVKALEAYDEKNG
jgi:O-acetyl-ADP-ribose deacetylase (regulator of RNase III)